MSSSAAQVRSRISRVAPQIGRAAVERARLTVVPHQRTRAARMPFVALVSMVLLGGVVGLLLFNTSMQQAAFATTALEQQATTLQAREQTLRMELDVLRDPQRVATAAQEMGMVTGTAPLFLDQRTGKVIGGTADGAPLPPGVKVRLQPLPAPKPPVLNPAPLVVEAPVDSLSDTVAEAAGTDGAGGTDGNKPNRQQNRQQNRR